MTENEIRNSYNEITNFLVSRKLKPAFDKIGWQIEKNELLVFSDEHQNLEETYRYMLKYTVDGIPDPERQKVYRKLIYSVLKLSDKINEALLLKYSLSLEYDKKRSFIRFKDAGFKATLAAIEEHFLNNQLKELVEDYDIRSDDMQNDLNAVRYLVNSLFNRIWFTDNLSKEDLAEWELMFTESLMPVHFKSLLTSALILSLQRYFDVNKLILLFVLYASENPEINRRALVGLLIGLYKYDKRIEFYPEIVARLKICSEDPNFKKDLEKVMIQFIRSRETEKIERKIKDEIIPEMIRISPNLRNKINLDSLMEEGLSDEKNPEWQEIFKDSPGLLDKMAEFSELQMEGADVFMGSFSMLKMFPFFNEFTNWFIPFYAENPDIGSKVDMTDDINSRFIDAISKAGILCNSDKYSFCFSIQNLPKENREFLAAGMNAEMNQFNEIQNDSELTDPGKINEFISNQYIQDLYRFYRLHPSRKGFDDIFSWKFDFHQTISLGEIVKEDEKIMRKIAEYYFAKNYFSEAEEIYQYLLSLDENGELFQKIGYCRQQQGNFKKALDSYLKAELYGLNPGWNYKKIALCYRNLKKPGKALEYYQLAEKTESRKPEYSVINRALLSGVKSF